jgi:hypothetical protein
MLWLQSYFDDGLMTSTFDGCLYVMRLYVYSGVWICECLSIALYSYSFRKSSIGISSFESERSKSLSLVPRGIRLVDES